MGLGDLKTLLRCLLPTSLVQAPPPHLVPTEMEIMLERLLANAPTPAPLPQPWTAITDMETMLQRLLLGMPMPAPRSRPVPVRSDWTTAVCFPVANRAME